MPELLYSWSWLVLKSLHIHFQSYLKPYRFRWWFPMSFSLEILGYGMHSLLDVIKDFHHIKDYCEDISPIVIADHRNEPVGFIKRKVSSQVRYWRASPTLFFRKHSLHRILILKYTMHIIHSYFCEIFYNICMATSTFLDTILGTLETNALILIT
jgi:hypothetical protein